MRPEHYSYSIIIALLQMYPQKLLDDGSPKSLEAHRAITKVMEDTRAMVDGEDIIRAVEMRYIKRTHTVVGVAQQLYVSERKVQGWCHLFVYAVARELHYCV